MVAAAKNTPEVVQYLLDNGADVNQRSVSCFRELNFDSLGRFFLSLLMTSKLNSKRARLLCNVSTHTKDIQRF